MLLGKNFEWHSDGIGEVLHSPSQRTEIRNLLKDMYKVSVQGLIIGRSGRDMFQLYKLYLTFIRSSRSSRMILLLVLFLVISFSLLSVFCKL